LNTQLTVFVGMMIVAVLLSVLLFRLLRESLRGTLAQTVKVPAGINFFVRSFFLLFLLAALSAAFGTSVDLKPDAQFMEYVWKCAEGLSSEFEKISWFLMIYLVLITILIATLKIKNDE
jgi:hypothetical protein